MFVFAYCRLLYFRCSLFRHAADILIIMFRHIDYCHMSCHYAFFAMLFRHTLIVHAAYFHAARCLDFADIFP